jgi:hypothetical protein
MILVNLVWAHIFPGEPPVTIASETSIAPIGGLFLDALE